MKTKTRVKVGYRVVVVEAIPYQKRWDALNEWDAIPVGAYGTIAEVFDEWLYYHVSVIWDNHPDEHIQGRLTQNPTYDPMWVRPDQIEVLG